LFDIEKEPVESVQDDIDFEIDEFLKTIAEKLTEHSKTLKNENYGQKRN